ncbi:cathepsin L-like peptidase [Parasteatoda tepidariorum]|uniref:cathepsin L-like peptidase n=1 Tax=Parasteatoda tepidariorum TaxID=114398 RepID=UPI001C7272FD|nr:procathepsin L [Parasteatoda tepidariorum]
MKILALSLLFTVVAANSGLFDRNLNEHWENFKSTYGKTYKGREEASRRLIWEKHVADIVRHNLQADLGIHKFRLGINEYSDMSHEDFVNTFNGLKKDGARSNNGSTWVEPLNVRIPDEVDWRDKGLVTPVKNQEQCGSCWAFSTTGALEGQHMKKTGSLVSLSEQNLVDCSSAYGNMGCQGGWPFQAFEYIKANKGVDTESSYPYTAKDDPKCLFQKPYVGATCTGFVNIPSGDENALKNAVATVGPVSVCIDAAHNSFQSYKNGIYSEPQCSTDQLDHAVLAVGYGSEDGEDYWLVKNSWGTTWGIQGYIKMSRNNNNQCGIATKASYPLV